VHSCVHRDSCVCRRWHTEILGDVGLFGQVIIRAPCWGCLRAVRQAAAGSWKCSRRGVRS
jgi:hypothetical protein